MQYAGNYEVGIALDPKSSMSPDPISSMLIKGRDTGRIIIAAVCPCEN